MKIIIDTREQLPFQFEGIETIVDTLPTGDYSIEGLRHSVAVERKSLQDLLGCIGKQRERFEAELMRLRGYRHQMVIVEEPFEKILSGEYRHDGAIRSQVHPNAAISTICAWQGRLGVPFMFFDGRESAQKFLIEWFRQIVKGYVKQTEGIINKKIEA